MMMMMMNKIEIVTSVGFSFHILGRGSAPDFVTAVLLTVAFITGNLQTDVTTCLVGCPNYQSVTHNNLPRQCSPKSIDRYLLKGVGWRPVSEQ